MLVLTCRQRSAASHDGLTKTATPTKEQNAIVRPEQPTNQAWPICIPNLGTSLRPRSTERSIAETRPKNVKRFNSGRKSKTRNTLR